MADDIVTRLRHVAWLAEEGSEVTDLAAGAADEIVRLRAEVERLTNGNNVMGLLWNAERALADQLAAALRDAHGTATRHAVCWCSTDSEYPTDCDSTIALAAYEAARKEEA